MALRIGGGYGELGRARGARRVGGARSHHPHLQRHHWRWSPWIALLALLLGAGAMVAAVESLDDGTVRVETERTGG